MDYDPLGEIPRKSHLACTLRAPWADWWLFFRLEELCVAANKSAKTGRRLSLGINKQPLGSRKWIFDPLGEIPRISHLACTLSAPWANPWLIFRLEDVCVAANKSAKTGRRSSLGVNKKSLGSRKWIFDPLGEIPRKSHLACTLSAPWDDPWRTL